MLGRPLLTEENRAKFMDIFTEAHKKEWPFDGDGRKRHFRLKEW